MLKYKIIFGVLEVGIHLLDDPFAKAVAVIFIVMFGVHCYIMNKYLNKLF